MFKPNSETIIHTVMTPERPWTLETGRNRAQTSSARYIKLLWIGDDMGCRTRLVSLSFHIFFSIALFLLVGIIGGNLSHSSFAAMFNRLE